jgi:hypothetical protein
MVKIEDVSHETAEETKRAHYKPFPFQFAPLIWFIIIPVGLALNAFIGFYPIRTIKKPTLVVSILSLFYNYQTIIGWIFFIVIFLHVLEAAYVFFKYPQKTNSNTRLEWTVQTFLLGFSSTALFTAQLERFNKKST